MRKKFLSLLDKLSSSDFRERTQALKELEENYPGWRNKKETKLKSSQLRKMLIDSLDQGTEKIFPTIKALGYIRDAESAQIFEAILLNPYKNKNRELIIACLWAYTETSNAPNINLINKFFIQAYPGSVYAIEKLYRAGRITNEELNKIFFKYLKKCRQAYNQSRVLESMVYLARRTNFKLDRSIAKILSNIFLMSDNVEVRRSILRLISSLNPTESKPNFIIKHFNFTVLHEWGGYKLLEANFEINGRKPRFLMMVNPSTGDIHVEGVPFDVNTCQEALSWRIGGLPWNPVEIT